MYLIVVLILIVQGHFCPQMLWLPYIFAFVIDYAI